ncbi:hypothetical protein NFI96_033950, partial [Prochilodus magdalenae]
MKFEVRMEGAMKTLRFLLFCLTILLLTSEVNA